MRFLILTQYYPPEVGAAQVRLSSFARQLRRNGHVVDVVTALPNYPVGRLDDDDRHRLARREVIDGIRVCRLWLYTATGAGARRLLSYLSFMVTGLVGAIANRRPDIVFVESPPLFLGIAGWAASRLLRCRFILNVSDVWPDSVRDLGAMRHGPWINFAEDLERWLYRHADAVTAVTEGIRDHLVRVKRVPAEQILSLPNGVDAEEFHTDALPARAYDRPTFLYTGNHGLAQGMDVILKAAELAPELDFLLVGDGSDKRRLEAEAGRRRLANVRFFDPVAVNQIAALYMNAVAGLATLRKSPLMEGARPAKVLAIMACGRPVLYSGSGEGAELVRRASAGITVPPDDAHALAEAARSLAMDQARASQLGANGHRYVNEHFRWSTITTQWLAQLEGVVSREPRA